MKVHLITHGCKANQYDTEVFRQTLEGQGAEIVDNAIDADACVVNTCTVTNSADAEARKAVRRVIRENPDIKVIVAGCSASMMPEVYKEMDGVVGVVRGHAPDRLLEEFQPIAPSLEIDEEPIGAVLLTKDQRGHRGWLKVQDGCNRRCSFCATRIARGANRSRSIGDIVTEAQLLSENHAELVLTGVHIGHYGIELETPDTFSNLVETLVRETDNVRFRLGSIEATEIDDKLMGLVTGNDRVVPHLHIPMQSGCDAVLRMMSRWHTRAQYRDRVLEIAANADYIGLGADIIVGFPGETDAHAAETQALVEELPFTYLHVFPYSVRNGTRAAELPDRVPGNIAADRSRVLRNLVQTKALAYQEQRVGSDATVVVEEGGVGITEDYLRVQVTGDVVPGSMVKAPLLWMDQRLSILT